MKIDIPEKKKLVYESRIPIRWGDMDAMNHLNNGTYFRYMETIRIDWFNSIDCIPSPEGEGPVIVNAFCNFYRQLEYPGGVSGPALCSALFAGGLRGRSRCEAQRRDLPVDHLGANHPLHAGRPVQPLLDVGH